MNRFGRHAMQAWQTLAPQAYAAIEDPNSHFSTLGEQAMNEWIDLWPTLVAPDQPGEGFMEKVGRIEAAKMRAEEVIRYDWLTPPPEDQEPDEGELPDLQAASLRQANEEWMREEGLNPEFDPPPWM